MNSNISMFADDTKLYVRADTANLRKQLQEDLSRMEEWAEKWQLRFHPDKCTVLRLGKLPADASTGYCMKKGTDSVTLSVTKVEKDLHVGVLVDSQLSFKDPSPKQFSKQIEYLELSVEHLCIYLNTDTMPFLFKGLVRPILEYGQAA